MYDFPEKTKLKELINQQLKAISCTANQIILAFSSKIQIDVTGHLEYKNNLGQTEEINVPIDNLSIFELIEKEVNDITIMSNKKEMSVSFKNGEVLKFISDEMYESVYIFIGDERFIV